MKQKSPLLLRKDATTWTVGQSALENNEKNSILNSLSAGSMFHSDIEHIKQAFRVCLDIWRKWSVKPQCSHFMKLHFKASPVFVPFYILQVIDIYLSEKLGPVPYK